MGKPKGERRLSDDEARAISRHIRTSPQKLNVVAAAIGGKNADAALAELTFSNRRVAGDGTEVLTLASETMAASGIKQTIDRRSDRRADRRFGIENVAEGLALADSIAKVPAIDQNTAFFGHQTVQTDN